MDGNPVRVAPDGYDIHELDGVEYGSIWMWAQAVLAKYGITYKYQMCDWCADGPTHTLIDQFGKRSEYNCIGVYHWGEHETSVRPEMWDDYEQGLIDFACILNRKGILITSPGRTASSTKTLMLDYIPADPNDPAFARQSD